MKKQTRGARLTRETLRQLPNDAELFSMRFLMVLVFSLTAGLLVWGGAAASQAPPSDAVSRWDAALQQLAGYQVGRSTNGLAEVMACLREADRDNSARLALERTFLCFLQSNATIDAKHFICRQLNLIGSAQSVPILAGFLQDPELSDMARYALEGITDPGVDQALLQALPSSGGRYKIGIISSLGQHRAAAALDRLLALVTEPDEKAAHAALGALKKIGGTNTATALTSLRRTASASLKPLITDALLWCADDLLECGARAEAELVYRSCFVSGEPTTLRAGALRGLLRVDAVRNLPFALGVLADPADPLHAVAADLIRDLPQPAFAKLVSAKLTALPPAAQVLVLRALADRGDQAAWPVVLESVRRSDEEVSVAALQAVGALGSPEAVPLLVEFLASPDERKKTAAQASLSHLRGPGVDARMVQALSGQEAQIQMQLLECLAARRATSVVPALIKLAAEAAQPLLVKIWQALGALAQTRDLPELVAIAAKVTNTNDLTHAEHALAAIVGRSEDKSQLEPILFQKYGEASVPARSALLRVAAQTGGEEALARTLEAWNDSRPELKDTALRVLADWPSGAPAPQLFQIVRTTTNLTYRAVAFRGYVRMAGLAVPSSPQAALAMYQQARKESSSPPERKLVLSGLASLAYPEALALAQSCLGDASVGDEAALATVKIAGALAGTDRAAADQALRAVLAQAKNPAIIKQAQDTLKRLETQPR